MRASFHGSISKGTTRQRQSRSEWARGCITAPQADKGWVEWDFSRLPRLQFLSAHPLPSGMVTAPSGARKGQRSASPALQLAKWTGLARGDTHARRPPQLRQGMHWSGYSAGRRASATLGISSCGHQQCGVRQTGRATAASLQVAGFQMVETSPKLCWPQRPWWLGDETHALGDYESRGCCQKLRNCRFPIAKAGKLGLFS